MTNIMNTNVLLLTRRITSQSITIHAWSTYLPLSNTKAHVLKCRWPKYSAAGDPPSQFTTLGRRRRSGGTEPPLARRREYLNPQSSAPRRTPELERERDVFPFILPHKAFIVACGQRGRGADTCTGAGGGTRKTNTYQILHLIHVHCTTWYLRLLCWDGVHS